MLLKATDVLLKEQTRLRESIATFANLMKINDVELETLVELAELRRTEFQQVNLDKERLHQVAQLVAESQSELNLRKSKKQAKQEQIDELKKQIESTEEEAKILRKQLESCQAELKQKHTDLVRSASTWIELASQEMLVEDLIRALEELVNEYLDRQRDLNSIQLQLKELDQQQLKLESLEADLQRLSTLCSSAQGDCSDKIPVSDADVSQALSVDELGAQVKVAAEDYRSAISNRENLAKRVWELDDALLKATEELDYKVVGTMFRSLAELKGAFLSDGDFSSYAKEKEENFEHRRIVSTQLQSVESELQEIDKATAEQTIDLTSELSRLAIMEAERDELSRFIGKLEQRLAIHQQNKERIDRETRNIANSIKLLKRSEFSAR